MHLNAAYIHRLIACFPLLVLIFLLGSCRIAPRKVEDRSPSVDVSKLSFSKNSAPNLRYQVIPIDSIKANELTKVDISRPLPQGWSGSRVPARVIERELLLKISLYNTSDSVQPIYFYPGAYFQKINLFRITAQGNAVLVPETETPLEWRAGFRLMQIAPGDSTDYVAQLRFVRTAATLFYPALVQRDFVESFVHDKIIYKENVNLITYLVTGIMLMMIIYSIAVYRLNRSHEFLYYTGYASSLALLFFLKSYMVYEFTEFNFFFESFWDFPVQCLGVFCYFMFLRKFLDTKRRHPFLDKTFIIGQFIIISFTTIYTVLYFSTSRFVWLNLFENITKQSLLVIGLIFIIYGLKRWNDKLLRLLVIGNIFLLVFSLISLMLIVMPIQFVASDSPANFVNSAIVWYEFALVFELAYFLSGLAYKNRRDIIERTKERERLRLENDKKELEKQMAILEAQQEERNRISADMHDELGSGVTAIRLMSEIVKTKMKGSALPEIDKISNSANDLITKMNTIIWTMTSSNDTMENLITYIRTYAVDFFENTPVECDFKIPTTIPNVQISGEKRRNIFLAVKEALNNILKHARATKVTIDVRIGDKLTISIQDNGAGVDFETLRRFGNGLKNMKSRLERVNGHFSIMNNGGGALAQFEMNL
jgi:signal transduction histidine kinase